MTISTDFLIPRLASNCEAGLWYSGERMSQGIIEEGHLRLLDL